MHIHMECPVRHRVDWRAGRRLLGDQRSAKTPQEQSDEEAEGKPPGKRPSRNGNQRLLTSCRFIRSKIKRVGNHFDFQPFYSFIFYFLLYLTTYGIHLVNGKAAYNLSFSRKELFARFYLHFDHTGRRVCQHGFL